MLHWSSQHMQGENGVQLPIMTFHTLFYQNCSHADSISRDQTLLGHAPNHIPLSNSMTTNLQQDLSTLSIIGLLHAWNMYTLTLHGKCEYLHCKIWSVHGTLNYLVSKQISVLWTLQVSSSVSWTLRKWVSKHTSVCSTLKVSMLHFVIWCPTALEVYMLLKLASYIHVSLDS